MPLHRLESIDAALAWFAQRGVRALATDSRTATCITTIAKGCTQRITQLNCDILQRDAQLTRHNLRHSRLMPLTVGLRSDRQDDFPSEVHAHVRAFPHGCAPSLTTRTNSDPGGGRRAAHFYIS